MLLKRILESIVFLLNQSSQSDIVSIKDFSFPSSLNFGDFSLPCFRYAKVLNQDLTQLANLWQKAIYQEIRQAQKDSPLWFVERVEYVAGYLNFFLRKNEFAMICLKEIFQKKKKFGSSEIFKNQKILIEFISPNNNKPLHLGHLRNAFLGESLARMLSFQGAKVFRTCLINDRGLPIAKSIYAFLHWFPKATPKKLGLRGDKFVGELYVEFEKRLKENPQLLQEAERIIQLWEARDPQILKTWEKLSQWAEGGLKATLKRLKIKFDTLFYESKLSEAGKKLALDAFQKGLLKKDETGAIYADLKDFNLPSKFILRADQTALYITADLYLGKIKFEKYKIDQAIWCVADEQELYLKQLFAIYSLLKFPWSQKCFHLSYGLVMLPEGKMKSREGKVVEADDLLDELKNLALSEVQKRKQVKGKARQEKIAEKIGQAALRFYLLLANPKTVIRFDPQASLALTGKTGPYLLYTYTRIKSILKKAARILPPDKILLSNDEEWKIVFALSRFPLISEEAAKRYDPSILAQYLFQLAQLFSEYYEKHSVLKAPKPLKQMRLFFLQNLKQILETGFYLLTLEPVEKM